MNSIQNIDILIVGGGLAGLCLALKCQKLGVKILLVDDHEKNHSSSIAAGIFNPLTGRKIRRTWKAEEAFQKAHSFYSAIQDQTKRKFFYPRPLVRVFANVKAANDWDAEEGSGFADSYSPIFPKYLNGDFGGVSVNSAGYLNIPEFLMAGREILGENFIPVSDPLSEKTIDIRDGAVVWKNYQAKKMIFCEGPNGANGSFFSWLPFSLTKGELLEIETVSPLEETIYIKGIFLLPLSKTRALVGATYNRNDLSLESTPAALESLVEKFSIFFNGEYKILSRRVGIRPTVKDRRPLLGIHPKHEQIGIFNGLGSKGVSLGPFLAEIMANHLINGSELPPEANIKRFLSFFED